MTPTAVTSAELPRIDGVSATATVLAWPFKPSRLRGLSRDLLLSHYENNYGGALRRFNAIERELASLDPTRAPGYALNGLKREALIAANSVVLHEIYFENLGGTGEPMGVIAQALERGFGGVGCWRDEFTAMGRALAGGSGWVLLTYSARFGKLTNQWAADHTHVLADGVPLLALDMYEHAYHLDFGANASAYVDAYMQNIDWARVDARFQRALAGQPRARPEPAGNAGPGVSVEELQAVLERNERGVDVIDVRLSDDFAGGKDLIATARHRDPERVEEWKRELARERPVFVYCAYGFEVCQGVTAALRGDGIDARFVRGGISAWHAIGGPVSVKH